MLYSYTGLCTAHHYKKTTQAALPPPHLSPSYHRDVLTRLDEMNDRRHDALNSSPTTPPLHEEPAVQFTPRTDDDIDDAEPLSSSSFLDELLRDDTSALTYSYASTWSSNYTMSNRVGAGRLLGKFYSWAGSSLERRLGRIALAAGIGSYAKAVLMVRKEDEAAISDSLWSTDERVTEKLCKALLVCAQYVSSIFFSLGVADP